MNESIDRALDDWLHEKPQNGTREGLERTLAATRRVGQRPGWTFPERWLPMQLTLARTQSLRPILAIVMLALLIAASVAAALFVGSQQHQSPLLIRNGVIALGKDGDILVADRPGGDLRPLVAGPEDDHSPTFSPDGTRLAFLRDTPQGSFLMAADADGTDAVAIPLPESSELGYWSFAPDGRSLMAFGRGDNGVFIRPVDPVAAPIVLDVDLGGSMILFQSGGPSFNPTNATEILVVGQRAGDGPRGIYVYDLATGAVRTIVEPAGDQYFFDVAWLPDGHITYRPGSVSYARVVAADGSGDQASDALRGQVSPISNDGTRIVAERDGEGDQAPRLVIAPINGDGEPLVIACGPGTDIECPQPPEPTQRRSRWVWSPDDSMLLAIILNIGESPTPGCDTAPSCEAGPSWETYLLVDAVTGHVTKLDWPDVGTPAWQRVAP
jgi:WD40-like Beta Propeller Repeat